MYLARGVVLAEVPETTVAASSSFAAVAAAIVVADFAVAAVVELAAVVAEVQGLVDSVVGPHQMNPLQLEMEED